MLAILLLLLSPPAVAQDASLQTFAPSFAPDAWLGHMGATGADGPAARFGVITHGEFDPVVTWFNDGREEVVVGNRATFALGGWFELLSGLGLGVQVPLGLQALQDDSELPPAFLGDLRIDLRGRVVQTPVFDLAATGSLNVPIGTRKSLSSDPGVSGGLGVVGELGIDRVGGLLAVDLVGQEAREDAGGLRVGPRLDAQAGLRVSPVIDRLDVLLELQGRFTLAEPPSPTPQGEIRLGARVWPVEGVRADVALGFGLGTAPGVPVARVVLGLTAVPTWEWPARRPRGSKGRSRSEDASADPYAELQDWSPPPRTPPPPPKRRIVRERRPHVMPRLETAELVFFDQGRAALRPEVGPALDDVAQRLHRDPRIAQLLVVGHASAEGDAERNYALSLARAAAVFRALVERGVSPTRLAIRGAGELSLDDLPAARRVELFVARRVQAWEGDAPTWEPEPRPWSEQP